MSEQELLVVASEVADIHRQLSIHLDVPKGRMDQILEDHRDSGIQQVVFIMLVKWQQSLPTSSNFRSLLAQALNKCHRVDVAERVLAGL